MTEFPSELTAALGKARCVTVLTGAGVSAESGVPTFRDAQTGIWAQFRPEELATPEAFAANPERVWKWYAWRREMVARAKPNPGHLALVALERKVTQFTLITQNVDGLHQRAGSRNVIELHGNISRVKCSAENIVVTEYDEAGGVPPRCRRCGAFLRPDVVWFGENLPEAALSAAERASEKCDVFFSIGTSAVVYPAAALPHAALDSGAILVEINPQRTPLTADADFFLQGPSGVILPALLKATWPDAA